MVRNRALKSCFITVLFTVILTIAYSKTAMATTTEDTYTTLSAHYSNGKYNKFYYNQLDTYAKVIYDKLLYNADNMKDGNYTVSIFYETATVREDEIGTFFQSAIDAFDRDHPEVFWLSLNKLQLSYSVLNYNGVNYVKNVKVGLIQNSDNQSYLLDEYNKRDALDEDLKQYKLALKNIMSYVAAAYTYDTVKNIHDFLVSVNDYNSSDNASLKAYKSISALLGNIDNNESPVCEGYARAFKVICDNLGIPCVIASGNASMNGKSIGHMWNCVLVDNHWYFVDTTWDDPILDSNKEYEDLSDERRYAFFLVGSDRLKKTHTLSGMFADKANYNMYFKYPLMNCSDYGEDTNYYKITLKNIAGGKISTNADEVFEVEERTQINVYVEPESGMEILPGSLKYNDTVIVDNSFTMPSENVVIYVKFMKSDVEIIPSKKPVSNNKTNDTSLVETLAPSLNNSDNKNEGKDNDSNSSSVVNNDNKQHNIEKDKKPIDDKNVSTTASASKGSDTSTNKDDKWYPSETSNISSNTKGNLPTMKYKIKLDKDKLQNNGNRNNVHEDIMYNVSDEIFTKDVTVEFSEKKIDNSISNLLIKKFGNNTLLDTMIFDLDVYDSNNKVQNFSIDSNEEFIIFVPVTEKFYKNKDKIRLFNLNDNKMIVVNAKICDVNDKLYFKMYFENPGTYILVEDLGIIEKNDNANAVLISSTITNDNIPKETDKVKEKKYGFYIAIAVLALLFRYYIHVFKKTKVKNNEREIDDVKALDVNNQNNISMIQSNKNQDGMLVMESNKNQNNILITKSENIRKDELV